MRKRALMWMSALVALVSAALVLAAPLAWAQEEGTGEGPLQQRLQQRWETVQQRLRLIITRFENNKERHVRAYQQAKEKAEEFLEKMSSKGLDVSKLSQDLETWDGMFKEFARDCEALIGKLEEILALDPAQAKGSFSPLIKEARQLLREVQQDALDIRLFYQQTIRADIRELRDQLPEAA